MKKFKVIIMKKFKVILTGAMAGHEPTVNDSSLDNALVFAEMLFTKGYVKEVVPLTNRETDFVDKDDLLAYLKRINGSTAALDTNLIKEFKL